MTQKSASAVGLVGYGGFLWLAFGRGTVRFARQHGESGWRAPVSATDTIGESMCVAGALLSIAAPTAAFLRQDGCPKPQLSGVRSAIACVVIASGADLALTAQQQMGSQWKAGIEPSQTLVTSGLFSQMRNPFYGGWMLASAGVAVAVPSPASVLGAILHVLASVVLVVFVEEPVLAQAHGPAYAEYRRQAGRFLPRARRRRPGRCSADWSVQRVRRVCLVASGYAIDT